MVTNKLNDEDRAELNRLFHDSPPHNSVAHKWKAASQTGFVKGCYACRLLQLSDEEMLVALRKRDWRNRWAESSKTPSVQGKE